MNSAALQSTLINLHAIHAFANILLSEDWSQLTRSVPNEVTTAVYLPNTHHGDVIGVFRANMSALRYTGGGKCLTFNISVRSHSGGIRWCNFKNGSFIDLINSSLQSRNITSLDPRASAKPFGDIYLSIEPHDHRHDPWLRAAEEWCDNHEDYEEDEDETKSLAGSQMEEYVSVDSSFVKKIEGVVEKDMADVTCGRER
jgi:hypothetical protein